MLPTIICHIMSSVDGRLLPGRWTPPFDGTDPSELFQEYASIGKQLCTGAWMFGKNTTAEAFPTKYFSKNGEHIERNWIYKPEKLSKRLFITIDPDANILYTSNFFRGDNIVVVLGYNATVDYLAFLEEKEIGYIVIEDIKDLRKAMERLSEQFGVHSISLQGGGIIDGSMLAAGLLDELSLVIYPGIDGNTTSPSIFEYQGTPDELPADGQSLEFLSSEIRPHGIIWLRYKFHKYQ